MTWVGTSTREGASLAIANAGAFRVANKAFFFTGAAISGYQFFGNVRQGNYAGAAKNGLTDVYEDPFGVNYQTTYAYDAPNNLVTVTQGTQTRTFNYSSLARLTSATNPETEPLVTSTTTTAIFPRRPMRAALCQPIFATS